LALLRLCLQTTLWLLVEVLAVRQTAAAVVLVVCCQAHL
jgi:hypothetical protein